MFSRIRNAVVAPAQWLWDRQKAYQLALTSPAGVVVLEDLAKFCRANDTVFQKDDRMTHILIGRHEVWLRIQQHLNLSQQQLVALYSGQPFDALRKDNINDRTDLNPDA